MSVIANQGSGGDAAHRRTSRQGRPIARRGFALLDVLVAGILLAIALVSVVGLSSSALRSQAEGEKLQQAAGLLDELLTDVLVNGPADYARRFPTSGRAEEPYDGFSFVLEIEDRGVGRAYEVRATVTWDDGRKSQTVETFIADREGDEPDPERAPEERIDR